MGSPEVEELDICECDQCDCRNVKDENEAVCDECRQGYHWDPEREEG